MKKGYFNFAIGIVLGLLLSLFVLYMRGQSLYVLWNVSFIIEIIILCMIPWCLKVLLKNTFSSCLMIAVSFFVCIVYGIVVMRNASENYWIGICVLHVCGVISTLILGKCK